MILPRDISGKDLVHALEKLGYVVTHRTDRHVRLSTGNEAARVHRLTVPNASPLHLSTLHHILHDLADHDQQLIRLLFV